MAKDLLPIDALIAERILAGVKGAELTYRRIAEMTGMSINRVGIILRQEPPPATVGEVGLIARCFGASASEIIVPAEEAAHASVPGATDDVRDVLATGTVEDIPDEHDADFENA